MKRLLSVLAAVSTFCTVPSVVQGDTAGGGVFIPIQDGSNHTCIDVIKSSVSMSVLTVQLKRTDKFYKESKSMGIKIDVKLLNQLGQPFVFPRGRQVSVSSYKGDIGYLPILFPIMAKYSLVNPDNKKSYVSIGLDVFLINIETESGLVKGISAFIDFSKNLPLPVNPYTQGVQLFGNFAQEIIRSDIKSAEEKLPAAVFSFDLASSDADVAQCERKKNSSWQYPILREGIVAVLWDYDGKPEDGFVRVRDVDNFCYYPTRSKRISYGAKVNGTCPEVVPVKFLNNPLIAFAVNKWSKNPSSTSLFKVTRMPESVIRPALTHPTAEAVVKKAIAGGDTSESMNSNKVKTYFDAINAGNLQNVFNNYIGNTSFTGNAGTSIGVSVREVETAIALQRCGLFGISANDCI